MTCRAKQKETMHHYQAFGLNIDSDLFFPELLPADPGANADVTISQGSVPETNTGATSEQLWLGVKAVGRFLIENGRAITYQREDGAADETLRLYLLGSGLGCVLQQRGFIVLHGNAISHDGVTCQVIVGHTGAGKSTTAAWHFLKGAKILADDVCAITHNEKGEPIVMPSYPQIKLWQASADLLGVPTQGLRRIRADFEKFGMPLGTQFAAEPLRLSAVIEIDKTKEIASDIQGIGKIAYLSRHSYRPHFLKRMGLTEGYTKKLIRLASMIQLQSAPRITLS